MFDCVSTYPDKHIFINSQNNNLGFTNLKYIYIYSVVIKPLLSNIEVVGYVSTNCVDVCSL